MGNVSLKVLEKSLKFLSKKGYEPCQEKHFILFPENLKYRETILTATQRPCATMSFASTLFHVD